MESLPGDQGWGKPNPDWKKIKAIFSELQGFFHLSTGHKHTGGADDAPKIDANGLVDGLVLYVDKQLTNAEVLAFRATPIELVAAPGADKAIVVHKFFIVSDDDAGNWTETDDDLVIQYADGVDISAAIVPDPITGGGVGFITQGVLDTVVVPDVNAAVVIFNTGGDEWGGGDAANSMSIRVWYSVVSTVKFS